LSLPLHRSAALVSPGHPTATDHDDAKLSELTLKRLAGRARFIIRLLQALLIGISLGVLVRASLPPDCYRKDLQEEYLSARALRDGLDVFTPVTELAARYFPVTTTNFPHPNPHPPVLALLGIPLTLLPFPGIVLLWLTASIVLLIVVGRWMGLSLLGSLALSAWPPMWFLLLIGQYELLVLALAMLGWRAAAAGRDWRAGGYLGAAAALKLYPVLFVVPFLARRRWGVVVAAAAVIVASQFGNLLAVGVQGTIKYYTVVLPQVSEFYANAGLNSAPYGGLLRIFGGAKDVAPLVHAPGVVLPLTVCLSCLALFALVRLEPEAAPAAVIVALPSVWYYYAVLVLPQLVPLLRSNARRVALPIAAAISINPPLVRILLERQGVLPPAMALLLAIQPAGFVALLVLLLATKNSVREEEAAANLSQPATRRAP